MWRNKRGQSPPSGFLEWIREVRASDVAELESMAKTIESHLEGVLGFWRCKGASNAKTEGFNNKIRRLIKQAYALYAANRDSSRHPWCRILPNSRIFPPSATTATSATGYLPRSSLVPFVVKQPLLHNKGLL